MTSRLGRWVRAPEAPSPRARLGAWALVVAALLLSPAWLLLGTDADRPVASAWQFAWLCAMALLLASTPPGAIKLSRSTSIWLIACGTAWLGIAAGAVSTPLIATPGTEIVSILLSIGVGFAVPMIAIGVVDRRPVQSTPARSPWAHALVLWHPATGSAIAWGARRLVGSSTDSAVPWAPSALIASGVLLAGLWMALGGRHGARGTGPVGMLGWLLMTAGVGWAVLR